MNKRLPLEIEFLQRERESILQEWRSILESSVNSHFFAENNGLSIPLMGQIFDDLVNAIDKNLYRNLNVTFDALLRDGRYTTLPVSDVRDFIFQFVPAVRTVLRKRYPEGGSSQAEIIFQRLKVIERDLRGVYSERTARNLLSVMDHHQDRVLDLWAQDLPSPIVSDHFSVLAESDRRWFVESTYELYKTILRGEDQELAPAQRDEPARSRLQAYLFQVVEFYEPKGFLVSDMLRALSYPTRLLEPRLYHKLSLSVAEYRVALLSLYDLAQTLGQVFSEAYSSRQMKNYYNEVSVMLHRIKNKLTAVPTTMETILMIPKDESEMAGDPMVLTTPEAEVLNQWLGKTDALLTLLAAKLGGPEPLDAMEPEERNWAADSNTLFDIQDAWAKYRKGLADIQPSIDNIRLKLEVGSIEMVNELLHIVYEGGKLTTELAMELQLRQNELYQREPPRRQELDIYMLVKRAFEESVPEAQSRNIHYELVAEDRGIYVFGVESELKRPFAQIIENGIKYTPTEGSVTVTLDYEPGHILFGVKDTGIGIPPGEEDLVFGLCDRCSNAKEYNKAGTGTGLYNDRKIILHHNGQVWVESGGLGQGSTFFVRLPIHHKS